MNAEGARDFPWLLPAGLITEELVRAVGVGVALELRRPKRDSARALRHRPTQAANSGLG